MNKGEILKLYLYFYYFYHAEESIVRSVFTGADGSLFIKRKTITQTVKKEILFQKSKTKNK